MPSPHAVLGVPHDATTQEVKKAYRKLCLQWHPDLVSAEQRPQAEKAFREISEAYTQLTTPGGTNIEGWRRGTHEYSRSARVWNAGPRKFSNVGLALWLSIPLLLTGVYFGQSYPRLAGELGRPHGLWYPPVNPFLKDEMQPRQWRRRSYQAGQQTDTVKPP